MSDVNDMVDVLYEIRDILEDIRLQKEVELKFVANIHNKGATVDEKLIKYKLKLLTELKDEDDQ